MESTVLNEQVNHHQQDLNDLMTMCGQTSAYFTKGYSNFGKKVHICVVRLLLDELVVLIDILKVLNFF